MTTLVLAGAVALGMAVAVAGPATTPQAEGSTGASREEPVRAPSARASDPIRNDDRDEVTTTVRNGDNFASVTQSGDPDDVERRVEKRPGYTRLEQRSGSSRSVIVQSNDPADVPLSAVPPAFREFFRR